MPDLLDIALEAGRAVMSVYGSGATNILDTRTRYGVHVPVSCHPALDAEAISPASHGSQVFAQDDYWRGRNEAYSVIPSATWQAIRKSKWVPTEIAPATGIGVL